MLGNISSCQNGGRRGATGKEDLGGAPISSPTYTASAGSDMGDRDMAAPPGPQRPSSEAWENHSQPSRLGIPHPFSGCLLVFLPNNLKGR